MLISPHPGLRITPRADVVVYDRLLAQPRQTIVIYMGLVGIEILCAELIAHGLVADTPAALIQQGTTLEQRVLTSSLATLPRIVREGAVKAPTIIIIGEVVKLREQLNGSSRERQRV